MRARINGETKCHLKYNYSNIYISDLQRFAYILYFYFRSKARNAFVNAGTITF